MFLLFGLLLGLGLHWYGSREPAREIDLEVRQSVDDAASGGMLLAPVAPADPGKRWPSA